ncbi:MAG: hypothetical protein EOO78_09795, partial [Oxalobacteraceae bacterium]
MPIPPPAAGPAAGAHTLGSIALLAFVSGDYLQQVLPLPAATPALGAADWAALAVIVLAALNLAG